MRRDLLIPEDIRANLTFGTARTVLVRRVENATIAALVVFAFVRLGFDWWWLPVLFLGFDLSAIGLLFGPRIGALSYNLAHNFIGGAVLIVLWAILGTTAVGVVGFAWTFHVALDRALGYGLKHADNPDHTDLGLKGRAAREWKSRS
jgi:hypothetical protein